MKSNRNILEKTIKANITHERQNIDIHISIETASFVIKTSGVKQDNRLEN